MENNQKINDEILLKSLKKYFGYDNFRSKQKGFFLYILIRINYKFIK